MKVEYFVCLFVCFFKSFSLEVWVVTFAMMRRFCTCSFVKVEELVLRA